MNDNNLPDEEMDTQEDLYLSSEEIMEDYRRRQMIEHMTGPMISIVLHVAVIIVLAVFMVGKSDEDIAAVEFKVEEMKVKEVDEPEIEKDLKEIEDEMVDDPVPTVEKPNVKAEAVQTETTTDFAENMDAAETNVQVETLLAKPTRSRLTMSAGIFGNRGEGGRKDARAQYGGSNAAERAVIRALEWLKKHQKADGSWDGGEAESALALLTFLAHGETHESKEYGETVTKGMKWLTNYMLNKNGVGGHGAYRNGIAAYALAEAYGLTKLPLVKPAMEKGLRYIVEGQQPGGGFNYKYRKGGRWDLSVAAWQFQALKAGKAAGADTEGMDEAIAKGIKWLKEDNFANGNFGYSKPGGARGSGAMQGAGTLVLQLLHENESRQVEAGLDWIKENYVHSTEDPPKWPHYAWYYQTQAMFHGGRGYWGDWNKSYSPMITDAQIVNEKENTGHWEHWEGHERVNNVYSTALCALSLQVYYRYLPTYKEIKQPDKKKKSALDFDEEDEDLGLDLN
ncbi:MAG: prenyltransferase/squalene oxidase repeat-containing protein [Lentisphaeria bacterium]